jgi:DNA-binding NarL/FixJ family response regulator
LVCAGLRAALRHDARVIEPSDLLGWASTRDAAVAVVSMVSGDDWSLLSALRRVSPELPIVALLDRSRMVEFREALRRGATSSLPRSATSAQIADVVRAALNRQSVVPSGVLHDVVHQIPADSFDGWSVDERRWLRRLADGASVATVAAEAGMSARTMARRLKHLYMRLGVERQAQALAIAARFGLLD